MPRNANGRAGRWSNLDADVLVIGAGIAGLAATVRLQRIGLRVQVVERAAELRTTGAGIVLHPNALWHLEHFGKTLPAAGAYIERQVTADIDGLGTSVVEWPAVWGEGQRPLAIYRRRLAELMHAQVLPGSVRWATKPQHLSQDRDGVSVTLSDGWRGRYRVVVGADGAYSWVRRWFNGDTQPRDLGQTYWRTTVAAEGPFTFADWRVWRSGKRFFGAVPLGDGRVHVFFQMARPDPERTIQEEGGERMRDLADMMGEPVTALVQAMRRMDEVQVRHSVGLLADRWVCGRVAIIGDAAHCLSPATTQGGALAVEDAAVLTEEIVRHGAGREALAAFESRRRQRVAPFARLAQLHTMLMESVPAGLGSPPPATPVPRGDSARWFRRLYSPLMAPA